jgi:hypothetical protein
MLIEMVRQIQHRLNTTLDVLFQQKYALIVVLQDVK